MIISYLSKSYVVDSEMFRVHFASFMVYIDHFDGGVDTLYCWIYVDLAVQMQSVRLSLSF